MISYLGFPIGWPDGRLFGTICVRDNKRNEYSEAYLKLLLHFRDMLQADLKSFATLHGQLEQHEAKIRRLVDANIIGIIIWDLEGRILEERNSATTRKAPPIGTGKPILITNSHVSRITNDFSFAASRL
jgi:GAF domain-containing protein